MHRRSDQTHAVPLQGILAFIFAMVVSFSTIAQAYPLQYRTEAGCDGVTVYFSNVQPGISQFWDLGDGTTSNSVSPVHVFPYGCILNVTLTVDHGNGQIATYALDVALGSAPDLAGLQFPNVFTPNGDGINDGFGPLTDQFLGPCSQMIILNRYGQKLFDGAGYNVMWDGRTFAGEPAVPGTYFYIFKVNGHEFTGHLSLHL